MTIASPTAGADSFRCGAYVVHDGMPSAEIREKCGEPDLVRVSEEPVFSRLENGTTVQTGVTTTHYWFYARGPNQFVARVTVRDSVAREIELLNVRDIASLDDK